MCCVILDTRTSRVGLVKDPYLRCLCSWRIDFGGFWKGNPNHSPCWSHENQRPASIVPLAGFRWDDKCSLRGLENFPQVMT